MFHEDLKVSKIVKKEVIGYDENGDVVYDITRANRWANGSGFVISYTEQMCDFLERTTAGAVVRVFLYIAHHQAFGKDGQFGYRCSHKYLQKVLGLSRKGLWEALNYLKDNFLVNVSKVEGATEFMVNPNYVTIGSDKKARMREWNRRWELHWQNVHANNQ